MTDAGQAGIALRPAVAADAPGVAAVFDAAVRVGWPYLGDLVESPMFAPAEWVETVAEHLVPPNALVVALDGTGAIIGFAAVHVAQGELFLLFVHPNAAGRGVGRALLSAADEALRAAGCRTAFLFTHEANARALSVYEAAGYRADGTVRESTFRGTPIRELRLVKQL
jgi:GNAT superfamily N-acetyltransferase